MNVRGTVIPMAALAAAKSYVETSTGLFRANEIEAKIVAACKAVGALLDPEVSMRATDRFLQQERKKGTITFRKGFWTRVKGTP